MKKNKLLSYDGVLMMVLTKFMYIVAANLLFLLCSIPIITIGASATAMYSLLIKYKKGDEPDIIRSFLSAFKEHFKQSTKVWTLMLVIALTLGFNFYIIFDMNETASVVIKIVLNIVLLFWGVLWMYFFPAMAYFENTVWGHISFAVGISISKLPYTCCLLCINSIPLILILFMAQYSSIGVILLLCCGFSLSAFFSSGILISLYDKYGGEESDCEIQE